MKKNLRLEWRTPEELADNPGNWRKHPQAQAIALKRVLAEVGWAGVVLYNERSGRLIDGHLRKKIAKKTEQMPVLVGYWSQEEEAKILLTLDPLGAMAQADADRLEALLETVHRDGPALDDLLGWIGDRFLPPRPAGELLDPHVPIEQAAELQAKWQTAPGQLWRIESHQILCGDSTQQAEVAQLWAGGGPPLRMVWTDSPYGIDYVRTKNSALKHLHKGTHVKTDIANDALSPRETHELFRRAMSLAVGRAKPGASGYAAVPAGPLMVGFIQAFEAAGFSFKHHLVWVKNQFVLGRSDYHYRHEPIIYGWVPSGAHYFAADRTQDTVFEFDKPASSEFHATTKPTPLIAQMIANSSRANELVL